MQSALRSAPPEKKLATRSSNNLLHGRRQKKIWSEKDVTPKAWKQGLLDKREDLESMANLPQGKKTPINHQQECHETGHSSPLPFIQISDSDQAHYTMESRMEEAHIHKT